MPKNAGMGGTIAIIYGALGIDAYMYAANNPLKFIDPSGIIYVSISGLLMGVRELCNCTLKVGACLALLMQMTSVAPLRILIALTHCLRGLTIS